MFEWFRESEIKFEKDVWECELNWKNIYKYFKKKKKNGVVFEQNMLVVLRWMFDVWTISFPFSNFSSPSPSPILIA
jgi:hypothetical protein